MKKKTGNKKKKYAEKAVDLVEISKRVRRHIISMSYRSKTAETGSALSIADILAVLYFRVLKINPQKPADENRDRFILSKGHGAAALYAVLAERGFFSTKELGTYRLDGGKFHGHPCRNIRAGIEVGSGSLGHGLSIGAGIAIALREKQPDKKVFVLMGDGECNEGSVWEAATFIAARGLRNIIAIVDMNGFQGFGRTSEMDTMELAQKFAAFGWQIYESDGHDYEQIEATFARAKNAKGPAVVIARTVAGKGIPEIENTLLAHYFTVDKKTYEQPLP